MLKLFEQIYVFCVIGLTLNVLLSNKKHTNHENKI